MLIITSIPLGLRIKLLSLCYRTLLIDLNNRFIIRCHHLVAMHIFALLLTASLIVLSGQLVEPRRWSQTRQGSFLGAGIAGATLVRHLTMLTTRKVRRVCSMGQLRIIVRKVADIMKSEATTTGTRSVYCSFIHYFRNRGLNSINDYEGIRRVILFVLLISKWLCLVYWW